MTVQELRRLVSTPHRAEQEADIRAILGAKLSEFATVDGVDYLVFDRGYKRYIMSRVTGRLFSVPTMLGTQLLSALDAGIAE